MNGAQDTFGFSLNYSFADVGGIVIDKGVEDTLEKEIVTIDSGRDKSRPVSTSAMGDAILAALWAQKLSFNKTG